MRFDIVKKGSLPTKQVALRPGWELCQHTEEYLDLEQRLFSIPLPDGERIYIIQRLTFESEAGNGDFVSAYMLTEQNNPDGDHDCSKSIPLTLEQAMALCFEEA